MAFKPLHDRVLVRRVQSDEKTKGGLIIPDSAKEKPAEGEIIAVGRGVDLPDLSLAEMQAVNPAITDAVYDVLGVHNSVASRMSYGGTAPDQVRAQVKRWQEIMGEWA